MTKLIRLVSDNERDQKLGLFLNTFDDDVIINPKSEIALYNLSCSVNDNSFTIDDNNSLVVISISDTNNIYTDKYYLNLTHGTYNYKNLDLFILDLNQKFNNAMTFNEPNIGWEWLINFNQLTQKFEFEIKLGNYFDSNHNDYPDSSVLISNVTKDIDNNYYQTPGQLNFSSWICITEKMGKSTSFSSMTINDDLTTGETILSLVQKMPSAINIIYQEKNLEYGIKYNGVGNNYSYYFQGVETEAKTPVPAMEGDIIQLEIGEGKIDGVVYQGTEIYKIFTKDIDNFNNTYHPIVIFLSNNLINNIEYISGAFNVSNNTVKNNIKLNALQPEVIGLINCKVSSKHTDKATDLYHILGFNKNIVDGFSIWSDLEGIDDDGTFESENKFKIQSSISSYLVELMNINVLNCYDGLSNKRRNILDVITEPVITDNNKLYYTTNTPLFLTLNNVNRQMIRNIQCRVLDENLQPLNMTGFSTLTIIIKDQ
jgi:hypothetical protein